MKELLKVWQLDHMWDGLLVELMVVWKAGLWVELLEKQLAVS